MKAMCLLAYLPSHSLGGRKTGEITDRTHDKITNRGSAETLGNENSDITVGEVHSTISQRNNDSIPSPEEQLFSILFKRGGETIATAVQYIFQKSWERGGLTNRCC